MAGSPRSDKGSKRHIPQPPKPTKPVAKHHTGNTVTFLDVDNTEKTGEIIQIDTYSNAQNSTTRFLIQTQNNIIYAVMEEQIR